MLFAFGDFFGTMRIQQSARGDHMTQHHFLMTQAWKYSDFWILIPLQESFTSEKQQNSAKIACK